MRRTLMYWALVGCLAMAGLEVGDEVHAAACKTRGKCTACSSCSKCKPCSKDGLTCSVCR
jgi:hypothetical protein